MISLDSALRVHGYSSLLATLLLAAGGFVLPFEGQAQEVESEVERQAREAFHGPDLEGKDGPMAKVGLDLARLYYKRERALKGGTPGEKKPLKAPTSMQVESGRVVIDAIAVLDSTEALRRSLTGLSQILGRQWPSRVRASADRRPSPRPLYFLCSGACSLPKPELTGSLTSSKSTI